MAQRKLNKQQKERVRQKQEKNRSKASLSVDDQQAEQTGLVILNHGKKALIEDQAGELWDCDIRQNLGGLVCGDNVIWQPATEEKKGVILAVSPRTNFLARPDFRKQSKPFVANIDQIIIVAAIEPELSLHLLDRYLIILEMVKLQGVIIINKTDLFDKKSLDAIHTQMAVYEKIGYPVLYSSAATDTGIDTLNQHLKNKRSIFVGQSGVGKSSLINRIIPDLNIRVGKLTQANHGKHTTSSSTLYHLSGGGDMVDSPGIRDFALWHIDQPTIEAGFREFMPYKGLCRFHNCLHVSEPDCAVKQAVEDGEISEIRLQSYQQMLSEIEE